MTYTEFLGELGRASLTVRAFADLVRMKPNSVSNYASSGEVPTHLALIAALMAELRGNGIPCEPVVERAAPIGKKTRGNARRGRFGGDRQEQLKLGQ